MEIENATDAIKDEGIPSETATLDQGKKKYVVILGLLVLVFIVATFILYFFLNLKPVDYVISSVPHATIYNHVNNDVEYFTTGISASIYSVMKYYGEEFTEEDLDLIQRIFYNPEDASIRYGLRGLENAADAFGYDYEWIELTPEELRTYINDHKRQPLIFAHNLLPDQPLEVDFSVVGVLIGVLESQGEVVMHDFYYGPNKTMTFQEYRQLRLNGRNIRYTENGEPEFVDRYFLLHPKNTEYLENETLVYPDRTENMEIAEPLINKVALSIAVGRGAAFDGYQEVQFSLLRDVINDPNFESHLPPYWKTIALSTAGVYYAVHEENLEMAEQLVAQSEALNGTLDEPWSDFWPGFDAKVYQVNGEIDGPYYARGVLQGYAGEYEESIVSYNKALDVYPHGEYSKRAILRSEDRIREQTETQTTE